MARREREGMRDGEREGGRVGWRKGGREGARVRGWEGKVSDITVTMMITMTAEVTMILMSSVAAINKRHQKH